MARKEAAHFLHEPERYKSPLMVPWEEVLATLQTVIQKESSPPASPVSGESTIWPAFSINNRSQPKGEPLD